MNRNSDLTDAQREAACSSLQVVSVSAAPGAGKTSVLVARIGYLLGQVEPERILCLVFTRSAAEEVRSRVDALYGPIARGVRISTFHGFAASVVLPIAFRSHGVMPKIATEIQSELAIRSLVSGPSRLPPKSQPSIKDLFAAVRAHEAYPINNKQVENVLKRLWRLHLIPTWDLVPQAMGWQLDTVLHVLVDEAQDTTMREAQLAASLSTHGSLFAVGDPSQAIMGFRHGAPILLAKQTHRLGRTFRFSSQIAAVANGISATFGGEAVEPADAESDVLLASGIEDAVAASESSTVILTRTNHAAEVIARDFGATLNRRDPFDQEAAGFDVASKLREGKLVVSTVHSFKGREADTVIAALPMSPPFANDEEARIAYVAATRARKVLIIVEGAR